MVQLGDIIEIGSSPEPDPTREKGKGKATPYRLELASSVIELTDSESEADEGKASSRCSHSNSHAGPSPSSPKRTFIPPTGSSDTPPQQNVVLASGSGSGAGSSSAAASDSGTEAGPTKQKLNGHNHNPQLFLSSDESPAPDTAHIGRVEVGVASTSVIEREPTTLIPQIPILPTPESDPIPFEDMDPTSTAVAQILEIIPNVEPTHLLQLIETHLPTYSVFHDPDADGEGAAAAREREATVEEQVQRVVGHVLHLLFENPDYPKADLTAGGKKKGKRVGDLDVLEDNVEGKGKGKAKDSSKKPKIDYASIDRPFPGGPNYFDLALYHLETSFPHIPKGYLRRQLEIRKCLYTPTHLSVLTAEKSFDENKRQRRPYAIKSSRTTRRKPQGDVAMEEEKAWLDAELAGGGNAKEVDETLDDINEDVVMDDADDEDNGTGIECQCCFADYPFSKMVQCPEAHLFCSTCISTYASTQLGTHNSSLTCIHSSSCSLPFPASELKRILSVKLYELYERLEQQKEIRQAGLVGLEECPFCEWKCVVEASTEEDKLFRCGNDEGGCGVVSCRGCKKLDHLPKSCKEVEEEKHLDGRHAIEEAMTRALMRNCPKCQKAFIKEQGCNKMSCPNCHTLSCYICRQVIKGYDHFNQQPGRPSTSADAKKCILWDAVEERHAQEVKEAAEKAMEEYRRDHPDIDESAIKVDLPVAPSQNAQGQAVVAPGVMPNMYHPMGYHVYNPNLNPIVGHAHVYPHVLPALPPPPPPFVPPVRRRRQPPQQPRPAQNTRARAAAAEEQHRARQRLDRVRGQRAKREQ